MSDVSHVESEEPASTWNPCRRCDPVHVRRATGVRERCVFVPVDPGTLISLNNGFKILTSLFFRRFVLHLAKLPVFLRKVDDGRRITVRITCDVHPISPTTCAHRMMSSSLNAQTRTIPKTRLKGGQNSQSNLPVPNFLFETFEPC